MTDQFALDCLNNIRSLARACGSGLLTEDTSTNTKTLQSCIAYLNVTIQAFGSSPITDTSEDELSAMAIMTQQFHTIMNAVA